MTDKSQEENKSQEPTDEFINEFIRMSQPGILNQYEAKNRERISKADFAVRDAFDKQWLKVTGKPYYQPVTTSAMFPTESGKNNTERSDPAGRQYRATVNFSVISWKKLPRRKIGKRYVDLFTLKGIDSVTQNERPIYQNLTGERLQQLLGTKIRDKILSDAKKVDHGEIKESVNIDAEGYWEVVFSPMQSQRDKKDVQLHWEGQCLIIKRRENVILPGFYIEAADHATLDKFSHEPGKGRQKVATIQQFPYTVLREATREEYLAQKTAGDKIQREKIERDEVA